MSDINKVPTDASFLHWLVEECEYKSVIQLANDRYAAIVEFMFTFAIVVGNMHNKDSYDECWCYDNYEDAQKALNTWDGINGEPEGWHRHTPSGRRRPNGNKVGEYIND